MKLIIAAGKTGGHVFPAVALAEEFLRQDKNTEILIAGSKEGMTGQILNREGITWQGLEALPLKGVGPVAKLKALVKLAAGIRKSKKIIHDFKPQIVIGTGGYTSAPLIIAAFLKRIPCFVQEQNHYPGMTNRYLGKIVKKVFTAFEDSSKFFPRGRTMWTGNPMRSQMTIDENTKVDYEHFGLIPGCFTILVFGGSQGAHNINMTMLEAIKFWPEDKKNCQIIHQTGEMDYHLIQKTYQTMEIRAFVSSFITQMAKAYAMADLVICRAGATSIAELMHTGKPSILIPYPYASDNHQTVNACYLEDRGAAIMIPESELNGQSLAAQIDKLYQDKTKLEEMGNNAHKLAKPEAAQIIVDYLRENYGQ